MLLVLYCETSNLRKMLMIILSISKRSYIRTFVGNLVYIHDVQFSPHLESELWLRLVLTI